MKMSTRKDLYPHVRYRLVKMLISDMGTCEQMSWDDYNENICYIIDTMMTMPIDLIFHLEHEYEAYFRPDSISQMTGRLQHFWKIIETIIDLRRRQELETVKER